VDDEHWGLDLKKGAQIFLKDAGVKKIYTDEMCTYQSSNLYYSYRGDNNTGRIASLIWIE
jgi:copper oxidase (laccase) domain-containing protein